LSTSSPAQPEYGKRAKLPRDGDPPVPESGRSGSQQFPILGDLKSTLRKICPFRSFLKYMRGRETASDNWDKEFYGTPLSLPCILEKPVI
jgi:hypothetical protein